MSEYRAIRFQGPKAEGPVRVLTEHPGRGCDLIEGDYASLAEVPEVAQLIELGVRLGLQAAANEAEFVKNHWDEKGFTSSALAAHGCMSRILAIRPADVLRKP